MKFQLNLIIIIAFFTISAIGIVKSAIINGTIAFPGQYPWIVYIETTNEFPCVGTIIDIQHVITSAQCVLDSDGNLWNPAWYRIIGGDLDILKPTKRRFVSRPTRFYVHPDYNSTTKENDLAILRSEHRFPLPHNTLEIADRYDRPIANRVLCQFAAWGSNSRTTPNIQQLFFGANILSRDECNQEEIYNNAVLENMICAGNFKKSRICNGSQGGGLFCNRILIGVLSFGIGCGKPNMPGVYTDIRKYDEWIKDQFNRDDFPEPGTRP